jgi:sulfoxide reductase heme-binding subunit YedZ
MRLTTAWFQRRPGEPLPLPVLRGLVLVLGFAPFARLLLLGALDRLGANPVEFVTRSTGTWTLVLLCATLAITPLRRISGWHSLIRIRRMLGLLTFFQASLHLMTYVWFDQWFDLEAIVRDVIGRPFITAGFAAFVILFALAATSSDAMIRRLGRNWGRLHRAVYLAAPLSVLHYFWHKAAKNDLAEPALYAVVVMLLLGWRLRRRISRRVA